MRTRTKPKQVFHDGRMKIILRIFLAKVRFVMIHGGFIKNPEFD
jgi:3-deoxy-D-arabino-heptulosonate 7-phosphate (DAHP) synthase